MKVRWLKRAHAQLREQLMKTQHTLYYRVDERQGAVEILRFWHTARGRDPQL